MILIGKYDKISLIDYSSRNYRKNSLTTVWNQSVELKTLKTDTTKLGSRRC